MEPQMDADKRRSIRYVEQNVSHACCFALVLCLLVGCTSSDSSDATADVRLQILDYDGVQNLIQSHSGKLVVLDAWSTSCGPCIREFPHLVQLSGNYPAQVACISLSFDYIGTGKPEDLHDHVLAFLRRQQATFDNVLSSVPSDEMFKKFNIYGPPAIFVYGPDGQLLKQFDESSSEGFTYDDIEQFLATQLESKTTD